MLQKLKKRLKEQKGFTLIELLAVIVILGIIAAIAVPAIGNIIANSRVDAIRSDAVQVLNAAKLYTTQNNNDTTITAAELDEFLDNTSLNITNVTVGEDAAGNVELQLNATSDATDGLIYHFNSASLEEINADATWEPSVSTTDTDPVYTTAS